MMGVRKVILGLDIYSAKTSPVMAMNNPGHIHRLCNMDGRSIVHTLAVFSV